MSMWLHLPRRPCGLPGRCRTHQTVYSVVLSFTIILFPLKVNWLCVTDWVIGCTKTLFMKDFKYPIYRSYSSDINGNLNFNVSVHTETEATVFLHVVCDSEHKIVSIENNIEDVFTLSQELQRIAVKLATMF